ncbi:hypothetical protein AWB77_01487 [Caballeronia fortuita]|uniref:Cyclic GMP-AMP synthase n=1 Tax=Caballeronia fortuita TaxID=1777138 RepID=A0A158AA47_9BURK|nr:hypothetical protein [Caballeronia fortuita]SAK53967.1 hypothetical protein AWB77_01487 [Caballeronia fortuita]
MFNLHTELNVFYNEHVRLPQKLRNDLAGYRDLNVKRLKEGLDELTAQTGVRHAHPVDVQNQGSYAMHTLNQSDSAGYDIDVALVFDEKDLPSDAAMARARVEAALLKRCSNFTQPPEARKNAVTVWYAENYHIDFAVYRKRSDWIGIETVEHAGADGWSPRKPADFASWFDKQLESHDRGDLFRALLGITVEKHQLRRVVRLVKAFARSRSGWSLPGGIVLTTLVCEVYRSDANRDDVALYNTLVALRGRLRASREVLCPVPNHKSLVGSERRQKEMDRLLKCVDSALTSLAPLFTADCTRERALSAWKSVFNHRYWGTQIQEARVAQNASALLLECGLAKRDKGTPYGTYSSGSSILPKGVHLRFRLKQTSVLPPFQVRWTVENEGDEATDDNQVTWTRYTSNHEALWTNTKYRGRQRMKCEVLKDGKVLESTTHIVRISE